MLSETPQLTPSEQNKRNRLTPEQFRGTLTSEGLERFEAQSTQIKSVVTATVTEVHDLEKTQNAQKQVKQIVTDFFKTIKPSYEPLLYKYDNTGVDPEVLRQIALCDTLASFVSALTAMRQADKSKANPMLLAILRRIKEEAAWLGPVPSDTELIRLLADAKDQIIKTYNTEGKKKFEEADELSKRNPNRKVVMPAKFDSTPVDPLRRKNVRAVTDTGTELVREEAVEITNKKGQLETVGRTKISGGKEGIDSDYLSDYQIYATFKRVLMPPAYLAAMEALRIKYVNPTPAEIQAIDEKVRNNTMTVEEAVSKKRQREELVHPDAVQALADSINTLQGIETFKKALGLNNDEIKLIRKHLDAARLSHIFDQKMERVLKQSSADQLTDPQDKKLHETFFGHFVGPAGNRSFQTGLLYDIVSHSSAHGTDDGYKGYATDTSTMRLSDETITDPQVRKLAILIGGNSVMTDVLKKVQESDDTRIKATKVRFGSEARAANGILMTNKVNQDFDSGQLLLRSYKILDNVLKRGEMETPPDEERTIQIHVPEAPKPFNPIEEEVYIPENTLVQAETGYKQPEPSTPDTSGKGLRGLLGKILGNQRATSSVPTPAQTSQPDINVPLPPVRIITPPPLLPLVTPDATLEEARINNGGIKDDADAKKTQQTLDQAEKRKKFAIISELTAEKIVDNEKVKQEAINKARKAVNGDLDRFMPPVVTTTKDTIPEQITDPSGLRDQIIDAQANKSAARQGERTTARPISSEVGDNIPQIGPADNPGMINKVPEVIDIPSDEAEQNRALQKIGGLIDSVKELGNKEIDFGWKIVNSTQGVVDKIPGFVPAVAPFANSLLSRARAGLIAGDTRLAPKKRVTGFVQETLLSLFHQAQTAVDVLTFTPTSGATKEVAVAVLTALKVLKGATEGEDGRAVLVGSILDKLPDILGEIAEKTEDKTQKQVILGIENVISAINRHPKIKDEIVKTISKDKKTNEMVDQTQIGLEKGVLGHTIEQRSVTKKDKDDPNKEYTYIIRKIVDTDGKEKIQVSEIVEGKAEGPDGTVVITTTIIPLATADDIVGLGSQLQSQVPGVSWNDLDFKFDTPVKDNVPTQQTSPTTPVAPVVSAAAALTGIRRPGSEIVTDTQLAQSEAEMAEILQNEANIPERIVNTDITSESITVSKNEPIQSSMFLQSIAPVCGLDVSGSNTTLITIYVNNSDSNQVSRISNASFHIKHQDQPFLGYLDQGAVMFDEERDSSIRFTDQSALLFFPFEKKGTVGTFNPKITVADQTYQLSAPLPTTDEVLQLENSTRVLQLDNSEAYQFIKADYRGETHRFVIMDALSESGKPGKAVFEMYVLVTPKHEAKDLDGETIQVPHHVERKLVFIGGAAEDNINNLFLDIGLKTGVALENNNGRISVAVEEPIKVRAIGQNLPDTTSSKLAPAAETAEAAIATDPPQKKSLKDKLDKLRRTPLGGKIESGIQRAIQFVKEQKGPGVEESISNTPFIEMDNSMAMKHNGRYPNIRQAKPGENFISTIASNRRLEANSAIEPTTIYVEKVTNSTSIDPVISIDGQSANSQYSLHLGDQTNWVTTNLHGYTTMFYEGDPTVIQLDGNLPLLFLQNNSPLRFGENIRTELTASRDQVFHLNSVLPSNSEVYFDTKKKADDYIVVSKNGDSGKKHLFVVMRAHNGLGQSGIAVFELQTIHSPTHKETDYSDITAQVLESTKEKLVFVGGSEASELETLLQNISTKTKTEITKDDVQFAEAIVNPVAKAAIAEVVTNPEVDYNLPRVKVEPRSMNEGLEEDYYNKIEKDTFFDVIENRSILVQYPLSVSVLIKELHSQKDHLVIMQSGSLHLGSSAEGRVYIENAASMFYDFTQYTDQLQMSISSRFSSIFLPPEALAGNVGTEQNATHNQVFRLTSALPTPQSILNGEANSPENYHTVTHTGEDKKDHRLVIMKSTNRDGGLGFAVFELMELETPVVEQDKKAIREQQLVFIGGARWANQRTLMKSIREKTEIELNESDFEFVKDAAKPVVPTETVAVVTPVIEEPAVEVAPAVLQETATVTQPDIVVTPVDVKASSEVATVEVQASLENPHNIPHVIVDISKENRDYSNEIDFVSKSPSFFNSIDEKRVVIFDNKTYGGEPVFVYVGQKNNAGYPMLITYGSLHVGVAEKGINFEDNAIIAGERSSLFFEGLSNERKAPIKVNDYLSCVFLPKDAPHENIIYGIKAEEQQKQVFNLTATLPTADSVLAGDTTSSENFHVIVKKGGDGKDHRFVTVDAKNSDGESGVAVFEVFDLETPEHTHKNEAGVDVTVDASRVNKLVFVGGGKTEEAEKIITDIADKRSVTLEAGDLTFSIKPEVAAPVTTAAPEVGTAPDVVASSAISTSANPIPAVGEQTDQEKPTDAIVEAKVVVENPNSPPHIIVDATLHHTGEAETFQNETYLNVVADQIHQFGETNASPANYFINEYYGGLTRVPIYLRSGNLHMGAEFGTCQTYLDKNTTMFYEGLQGKNKPTITIMQDDALLFLPKGISHEHIKHYSKPEEKNDQIFHLTADLPSTDDVLNATLPEKVPHFPVELVGNKNYSIIAVRSLDEKEQLHRYVFAEAMNRDGKTGLAIFELIDLETPEHPKLEGEGKIPKVRENKLVFIGGATEDIGYLSLGRQLFDNKSVELDRAISQFFENIDTRGNPTPLEPKAKPAEEVVVETQFTPPVRETNSTSENTTNLPTTTARTDLAMGMPAYYEQEGITTIRNTEFISSIGPNKVAIVYELSPVTLYVGETNAPRNNDGAIENISIGISPFSGTSTCHLDQQNGGVIALKSESQLFYGGHDEIRAHIYGVDAMLFVTPDTSTKYSLINQEQIFHLAIQLPDAKVVLDPNSPQSTSYTVIRKTDDRDKKDHVFFVMRAKNNKGENAAVVFEIYNIKTELHEKTNAKGEVVQEQGGNVQKPVFIGGAKEGGIEKLINTISNKTAVDLTKDDLIITEPQPEQAASPESGDNFAEQFEEMKIIIARKENQINPAYQAYNEEVTAPVNIDIDQVVTRFNKYLQEINIRPRYSDHWDHWDHGDMDSSNPDTLGRLYIHIKPDQYGEMPTVIHEIQEEAKKRGIVLNMKSSTATVEHLNRRDNIRIIFHQEDQENILELAESVWKKHNPVIAPTSPRFTSTLLSSDGSPMRGISFAKEVAGNSYGGLIASAYDSLENIVGNKMGNEIRSELSKLHPDKNLLIYSLGYGELTSLIRLNNEITINNGEYIVAVEINGQKQQLAIPADIVNRYRSEINLLNFQTQLANNDIDPQLPGFPLDKDKFSVIRNRIQGEPQNRMASVLDQLSSHL